MLEDVILKRLTQLETDIMSMGNNVYDIGEMADIIRRQINTMHELIHIIKAIYENKFR